jgi:protein DGCR14
LENYGTPYISKPGGSSRPARTPLGARGWETPADIEDRDREEFDELDGEYGELAGGPSRSKRKRQKTQSKPVVRDDLSLDTFQRNYTSEDNASFVQIVQEDNQRRREERWGWAWEAERKAEQRKLEGEEKRKMILDAATSGQWRVDANGKRLIGGLAEGGRDRPGGEVWKEERRMIAGPATSGTGIAGPSRAIEGSSSEVSSSALVQHSSTTTSGALVLASDAKRPAESVVEQALPDEHPLNKALVAAGLPGTALVSVQDGQIVPRREVVSGEGDGRGRGQEERAKRDEIEKAVLGDEVVEHLSLAGSGGDQWGFKVCSSALLFEFTN